MQYIKKDLGSYNIHLINTDKYKTVTMKVVFHSPIKKEEITMRNILSDILLQSTKNYPTKRDMIIESENLYAADIYNNTQRFGNYISTSFILQVLNDKYTEPGNLENAIRFLSEIILNPDINDNGFNEEKLKIVKHNCEINLSSIKENPTNYATIRLNEEFQKNSPISYRMTGYLEDLQDITQETLYNYYQKMIDRDHVDIFIAGEFDNNEIIQIIKSCFKFRKIKKYKIPFMLEPLKPKKKILATKENIQASQSKLAIGCTIGKLTEKERNYSLVLGNIILGGGTDSKLFKTVREKNSLCYSIYSSLSKLDNTIIIKAGIDKNNYKKTVEVIKDVLNKIQKGKITDKDIKMAKELYDNSILSIEEDPMQIINEYLTEQIVGFENYKERSKIMNKVTKRSIIKTIKKIKIDTIFLLEGDEE